MCHCIEEAHCHGRGRARPSACSRGCQSRDLCRHVQGGKLENLLIPRGPPLHHVESVAEREDFCKYMCKMMYLPFKYDFSVLRWQRAIDVILEKLAGVKKIHLMRIIGLVEGDFNCALKILYSEQLMKNAEDVSISADQWGGRKNRDAIACATR